MKKIKPKTIGYWPLHGYLLAEEEDAEKEENEVGEESKEEKGRKRGGNGRGGAKWREKEEGKDEAAKIESVNYSTMQNESRI